jgi:ribosomal protein S18 acetylase RimI-like enzyme
MAMQAIRLGEGGESEAEAYKALRLDGLKKNPTAFANSYEQMAARSIDDIMAELRANIVVGVLIEETELIGVGGIRREEAGKMNHKGIVYGNYVSQNARRRGVGRLIMQELENRARAAAPTELLPAFEELQLRVVEGTEAAIKLYHSLGFTQFGFAPRAIRYEDKYIGEHYLHKFLIDTN